MMFKFDSPLFWYKLIFIAELVMSELLFVVKLRRRNRFPLRAALAAAGLFSIAFFMPIVAYNALWTSFMFISMFAASLGAIKICFDVSWWNIFFCGLAAYTVQHLAYVIFSGFIDVVAQLYGRISAWNPYSEVGAPETQYPKFLAVLIYFTVYGVVYWMMCSIYARKVHRQKDLRLGNTKFVVLAGIIILTAVVFSLIAEYSNNDNLTMKWLERGYSLLTGIMALQLQFGQLTEKEIQTRLNMVQQLLFEEQKQYETVKQNIDIISLKCHDLKQQIRVLRFRDHEIDKSELEEIENAINIYESVVKTGNETLDLILTDKNLICKEKGIRLTCVADGAQLNFMKPADIYALFGNALDNAMDAALNYPETSRDISLHIRSIDNMVSVHVENYFTGSLSVKNGLPVTTKGDSDYHGYGMLSIKMIVEKYGGNLTFEAANDTFNLNILFYKNALKL